MISDPNLILYASISKGPTILAEFFTSGDPDLKTLALKCIDKTPPFHSIFTHTVRNRTYTFLIADPLVYFAIFNEDLSKSQGLWLLNRLKVAFQSSSIENSDNLSPHCFQLEFDSIFRELFANSRDLESLNSPETVTTKDSRIVSVALLGNPCKGLKKKRRLSGECNGMAKEIATKENNVGVCYESDDDGMLSREFSVSLPKNGLYMGDGGGGRQKAKQIWRKHVLVVLGLDLVVCSLLFGIWLWVCRGFKCIDG